MTDTDTRRAALIAELARLNHTDSPGPDWRPVAAPWGAMWARDGVYVHRQQPGEWTAGAMVGGAVVAGQQQPTALDAVAALVEAVNCALTDLERVYEATR